MRVIENDTKAKVQAGGGKVKGKFTFAATGAMFRNVMGNLYSNKVESVLREIISNALDAHAMSNNTTDSVEVLLPSLFNKTFTVRDYGPGMTPEFVEANYTCVGFSAKTGTNVATGMFGLGSKSPFAVADTFNLVTYQGGTYHSYSFFFDEDDHPVPALMGTGPTTERDGVLVSVPVQADDVPTFEVAMRKLIFAYYDKNVTFSRNLSGDKIAPMEFVRRSVNVVTPGLLQLLKPAKAEREDYNPWAGSAFIRQGTAIYPLEIDKLSVPNYYGSTEYYVMNALQRNGAVPLFDMPIGTFNVTPSREAISYDTQSVANLRTAILQRLTEASLALTAAIGDAKDIRTAYKNVIATFAPDVQKRPSAWTMAGDVVNLARKRLAANPGTEFNYDIRQFMNGTPHGIPYKGKAYDADSGPTGYLSKNEHFTVELPAIAVIIPSSMRYWEQRTNEHIAAHTKFDLSTGDQINLVVFRTTLDRIDAVAKHVEGLDFFSEVYSDHAAFPAITKAMEGAATTVTRRKYGRDDVFILDGSSWSDGKKTVDFSQPAYFVVREGSYNTIRIMPDIAKRTTFDDAGHMDGWKTVSTIGVMALHTVHKDAAAADIIDGSLPVYRLTQAQYARLADETHGLVELTGEITNQIVNALPAYLKGAQAASFKSAGYYSMTNTLADRLIKVLSGQAGDDLSKFVGRILDEDTFAYRLAGGLNRGNYDNLARLCGINAAAARYPHFNRIARTLFRGGVDPDVGTVADHVDEILKERFPLISEVYNISNVPLAHLTAYIDAVTADATMPVIDRALVAPLTDIVDALRTSYAVAVTKKAKAA